MEMWEETQPSRVGMCIYCGGSAGEAQPTYGPRGPLLAGQWPAGFLPSQPSFQKKKNKREKKTNTLK